MGSDAATQPSNRSIHAQIFLRVSISILSSLIKFEIARLDVRSAASTPGTKSSTLPEDGSTILIKSAPFVFTVQVQERGNKPLSTMCLSSKAEIIDVYLMRNFISVLSMKPRSQGTRRSKIHDEMFRLLWI